MTFEDNEERLFGRGSRQRKEINYSEVLTEKEWLKAVEDGSLEAMQEAKKQRRRKRKAPADEIVVSFSLSLFRSLPPSLSSPPPPMCVCECDLHIMHAAVLGQEASQGKQQRLQAEEADGDAVGEGGGAQGHVGEAGEWDLPGPPHQEGAAQLLPDHQEARRPQED